MEACSIDKAEIFNTYTKDKVKRIYIHSYKKSPTHKERQQERTKKLPKKSESNEENGYHEPLPVNNYPNYKWLKSCN